MILVHVDFHQPLICVILPPELQIFANQYMREIKQSEMKLTNNFQEYFSVITADVCFNLVFCFCSDRLMVSFFHTCYTGCLHRRGKFLLNSQLLISVACVMNLISLVRQNFNHISTGAWGAIFASLKRFLDTLYLCYNMNC